MSDLKAIRHQLGLLCGRKRHRRIGPLPEFPFDWRPTQVLRPGSNRVFCSDQEAWEFIQATLLDERVPMEEIELNQPPGKKGYVLLAPAGERMIYIKLMLGNGVVRARSFHYSTGNERS